MKIYYRLLLFLLPLLLLTSACKSDIEGDNLFTFKEMLVGQYIDSDTTFSEFSTLLEKTGIKGYVNSYGELTCFVPTNKAMFDYYRSKGKNSQEQFTMDSLKSLAYDHIINQAIVRTAEFNQGVLPYITMSERNILVQLTDSAIYVNKTSQVIKKDVDLHNGIVHIINKCLDPVREGLALVVSKDTTFRLFYSAMEATGLVDSILKTKDDGYSITDNRKTELENLVKTTVSSERHAPTSRKFGYTLLMESDETYKKYGITTLNEMKAYAKTIYDEIYPEDAWITDITNRKNSLNRFVAYHMVNKKISSTKFIMDYFTKHMSTSADMYEYIEPMCPNTLIEVKFDRVSQTGNRFNTDENGNYIALVNGNYDNVASNGYYHEIDKLLVYSKDVESMLSSKRLRFDIASIFPELTNNNMRGRPSDNAADLYRNAIPPGYIERLQCTEQTVVCYSNAHDKLMNFQGDEVFLVVQNGKLYDFTMTTPPVPSGSYEVRFGYQSNGRRGVAQFYFDGNPTGVPVNLNTLGTDVQIGYIEPGADDDDPYGFQNDKMMRNRGYMKGPNSFKAVDEGWYKGSSARMNSSNLRKILGIYKFSKTETHKLMVKGLSGGQFQIDFIEFIPTSILENEDIN